MNAPTLLIGLGGTGCKIIERVSQMVNDEQRNNIAFAVFDTDINDLRGIQERNPFIKIIQTSTKQTVGEYLNKDTHARDTWFPVNAILNGKTLTEGAGQVRSISRLALETVISAGKMEPLHEAVQSLYKVEEDKAEQAVRVVIVSSLAGGTGSGLILPVAMYVRNYLKTHFRQSANITRGFFILPEVFHEVITGQTERNNLSANAYATLRELDAFLMKGDNTLHERYRDTVRMQFPRAASSGYEEYSVRPYDFCFLFDAQNAEGGKLNSFDAYLEHAANCIYAQSIGPMNKRSNSSEDNTIRKLAKERGRNRYAGAGASMLIYPFEDIKSFIALKWAKQSVSSQWMVFDNLYRDICEENSKKIEQGLHAQNPDPAAFYASQIESMAKQDDPFARAIISSCTRYGADGVTKKDDRWREYVGAVVSKIAHDVEAGNLELDAAKSGVNQKLNNLGNEWEEYVDAYTEEESYRLKTLAYVEEVAQTLAYSMFKTSKPSDIDTKADYKLEKYLTTNDGNFLHPNAIRYLLIKTSELMKKQKAAVDAEVADLKEYFESFEKNTFDDPETEDVIETAADLAERKRSLISRIRKRPSGEQDEIRQKMKTYFNNTNDYMVKYSQAFVLSSGIDYVDSIIRAFESFYRTFESKVETIDKSIADIYKKFSDSKGTTARYVCASRESLDKIHERKPYMGSTIAIDVELAKEIYLKVLEYALMKEKPGNNRHFNKLFDEGIIGYFKKAVMRDYGNEIDIDIIQALENEAVYEGNVEDADDPSALIDQYVRKTITDIRNLSCPFIESPMGEARDPINSCTFNISLKPAKGDTSPKAQLIQKELMNYGGEPDEDISKYMIMFYQSFYGLRANDLSKFAPPAKSLTYSRTGGEYFKAYYELVDGIHPESHLSKEISPHIDRWWHIVTKMPDLDEENQAKQECEINAAFFWGLLNRYIETFEDDNKKIYKLKMDGLGIDRDELRVSNGTECDKLYEVLDSVAIYPELVRKILDKINARITEELNDGVLVEDGLLMRCLKEFSLEEPGLGSDMKPATSILDFPLLMKKSAPQETYYEDNVIQIIKTAIEQIETYLSKFCSPKELPNVMSDILLNQFEQFLKDVEIEKESNESIYKESIFYRTCSIVEDALRELGNKEQADNVKSKMIELRK